MTSAINRYYDASTDQFLSIDPFVAETNQPYVFTNDDPLNAEDPLGDAMSASEANSRSGPSPTTATSHCSGPGAPTEAQLIGCEDYVITGKPYAPTDSGTAQWSNLGTTFGTVFGLADPLDGAAAFDDASDATPQGREYSWHYLNETGPTRNIPGSIVDETIDHPTQVTRLTDRTIYYDENNNVTVVRSDTTGKIMSARKGKP